MNRRILAASAGAALALLALAGCSSGATGGGYGGSSSSSGSTPATSAGAAPAGGAASGVALKTGNTTLGTVVVDGKGLTVYVFDKDTANSGKSVCTGACAGQWPAVESASAKPDVQGVTGTVGTITGVDGKLQVTVDGWPLYTFAGDSSAGDVTGQGFGGIWWAVKPDGTKVTSSSSPSSSTGGGTNYNK